MFLIISLCNIICRYKTSEETYRVWDFIQPSYLFTVQVCHDLFLLVPNFPQSVVKAVVPKWFHVCTHPQHLVPEEICFGETKIVTFFGRNLLISQQIIPIFFSGWAHCSRNNVFPFAGPFKKSKIFRHSNMVVERSWNKRQSNFSKT